MDLNIREYNKLLMINISPLMEDEAHTSSTLDFSSVFSAANKLRLERVRKKRQELQYFIDHPQLNANVG